MRTIIKERFTWLEAGWSPQWLFLLKRGRSKLLWLILASWKPHMYQRCSCHLMVTDSVETRWYESASKRLEWYLMSTGEPNSQIHLLPKSGAPSSTLPSSFTPSGPPDGWRHCLHSWTCPCSIMYLPKDSSHGHIQKCAFLTVASFTLEINHHTCLHLSHYNPNQSKKSLFLGCAQPCIHLCRSWVNNRRLSPWPSAYL